MNDSLGDLRDEVAALSEEVTSLREELVRVRRNFAKLQRLVESRVPVVDRDLDSISESGYSFVSEEVQPQTAGGHSYPASSPSPSRSVASRESSQELVAGITWKQREAVADEVGLFLARAISGQHRGTSGRSKVPIASTLWIIVRDYAGQIYDPVKVVRSWGSCRRLCKPDNRSCGDSVFVGLPTEGECRRAVAIAGLSWPQAIEP